MESVVETMRMHSKGLSCLSSFGPSRDEFPAERDHVGHTFLHSGEHHTAVVVRARDEGALKIVR